MSVFSRFSDDSDIFIYTDPKLGTVCYDCALNDGEKASLPSTEAVLQHMSDHTAAGHKVMLDDMNVVRALLGMDV